MNDSSTFSCVVAFNGETNEYECNGISVFPPKQSTVTLNINAVYMRWIVFLVSFIIGSCFCLPIVVMTYICLMKFTLKKKYQLKTLINTEPKSNNNTPSDGEPNYSVSPAILVADGLELDIINDEAATAPIAMNFHKHTQSIARESTPIPPPDDESISDEIQVKYLV